MEFATVVESAVPVPGPDPVLVSPMADVVCVEAKVVITGSVLVAVLTAPAVSVVAVCPPQPSIDNRINMTKAIFDIWHTILLLFLSRCLQKKKAPQGGA